MTVDSTMPSPFASALLFGYVANYIYDGDAPLAERRAQALSIDQAQLRELLGEAELRELLDADALADVERQLQQLDPTHHARSVDGVHDLLLRLGDLTADEVARREPDRRGRRRSESSCVDAVVRSTRRIWAATPRAVAGRVRGALPRRARRAAAGRACPSRCSSRSPQRGARSRAALRADARPVHHRRVRRRATASAAATAEALLKALAAAGTTARG